MDGVVKLIPVPNIVPPVAAAYQFKVLVPAVAPKVSVPVPQRVAGVVAVIVGVVFTVMVIFAQLPDVAQPPSPLA